MNEYEIAVLYDPGLEIDLEKGADKVTQIFKDNGGKVLNIDNWGKKKLAYKINKQDHGIYVFYNVQLPPENVQKIETAFNITDEIIRFLIVRPDLKAMAKAEEAKAQKAKKAEEIAETEAGSKEEKTENKTKAKENEKKPKESGQLKQTNKKSSFAKPSKHTESNNKTENEQTNKEV